MHFTRMAEELRGSFAVFFSACNNLEEVRPLGRVLQQTLDQRYERGFVSLHLRVPELPDNGRRISMKAAPETQMSLFEMI